MEVKVQARGVLDHRPSRDQDMAVVEEEEVADMVVEVIVGEVIVGEVIKEEVIGVEEEALEDEAVFEGLNKNVKG